MITEQIVHQFNARPTFKTLPGTRCSPARVITGRDVKLLPRVDESHFVFCTEYAEHGGCVLEDAWRSQGKTVFEEISIFVEGELKGYRVEVFEDGSWVQVDYMTGERKHKQHEMS